jgi:hypothetical protein
MDDGACVCGGLAPVPCFAAAPARGDAWRVSGPLSERASQPGGAPPRRRRTFDSAQSAESKNAGSACAARTRGARARVSAGRRHGPVQCSGKQSPNCAPAASWPARAGARVRVFTHFAGQRQQAAALLLGHQPAVARAQLRLLHLLRRQHLTAETWHTQRPRAQSCDAPAPAGYRVAVTHGLATPAPAPRRPPTGAAGTPQRL